MNELRMENEPLQERKRNVSVEIEGSKNSKKMGKK
jgi:hypothetical protein